jgi:hypothetical protein
MRGVRHSNSYRLDTEAMMNGIQLRHTQIDCSGGRLSYWRVLNYDRDAIALKPERNWSAADLKPSIRRSR